MCYGCSVIFLCMIDIRTSRSILYLRIFTETVGFRFNDPWFRQKITDEYIKERSEYRRTGKNAMERKWEEYCKYKKERGDWTDLGEYNK